MTGYNQVKWLSGWDEAARNHLQRRIFFVPGILLVLALFLAAGCSKNNTSNVTPDDEAKSMGLHATNFIPQAVVNYFAGMDVVSVTSQDDLPDQLLDKAASRLPRQLADPLTLSSNYPINIVSNHVIINDAIASATFGRNTWMIWCGGNDYFWDWLADHSLGFMDLLKVLDSRQRATRWRDAGLVNEPGMNQANVSDRFGLWLDQPEDPLQKEYRQMVFAEVFDKSNSPASYSETSYDNKYASIPPWKIYGLSSGIVGLRLFPNPKFDESARRKWDGARYYSDRNYYSDPNLVRPFRVGMSCAFCHASAHPLNPPLDPAHPRWENISGSIGSQYLRIRAIFGNLLATNNFVYHVLDSQPPGTIDTSLIASDNINNPNTMNAIFGVPQRVVRSFENPPEWLEGGSTNLPSLWRDPGMAPDGFKQLIPQLPNSNTNNRWVPRILLDGADSIGAWGALARVYLNIGTYSEQWTRLQTPLIGFIPPKAATNGQPYSTQMPFTIKDCEEHSVYWQATQMRVEALRDYFLTITPTMPLVDAKGADDNDKRIDASKLALGRRVFARNCIVCHSSIQPESNPANWVTLDSLKASLDDYVGLAQERSNTFAYWAGKGEFWDHDPGQWLRDPTYEKWATNVVEDPGFWRNNFLSTDYRVPVNYVGTDPSRALGNNSTEGHVWQDFASWSYRHMPSIGGISYYDPFSGTTREFTPRHAVAANVPPGGGGPGFYRPPSLISIWATAPFLHNNSLGLFNNDPSVKGRLAAFDDAIHKLLWYDRRMENTNYAPAQQLQADHGLIWRTPGETYLVIPGKDVPAFARGLPWPHVLDSFADWLESLGKWRAVPMLALLVLGFVTLGWAGGASRFGQLQRLLGYFFMSSGIILGLLIYFLGGNLGDLKIGPIPKGTPVDLLANINPDAPQDKLKNAIRATINGLAKIQSEHLDEEAARTVYREEIAPALLEVSKCPDFVMDKGHYFPWFQDMTDEEKEALIELLKTF